jgi:hypothetical protein
MDNLYLAIDRASLADDELLRMAVEDMRSAFSSCLPSSASRSSSSASASRSSSSSSSFAAPTSKYPIKTLIFAATAVIDRNAFDCVPLEDSLALLVMVARDETSPHVVAVREAIRQFDASKAIFDLVYPEKEHSTQESLVAAAFLVKAVTFDALRAVARRKRPNENKVGAAQLAYFVAGLAVAEATKEDVDEVALKAVYLCTDRYAADCLTQ